MIQRHLSLAYVISATVDTLSHGHNSLSKNLKATPFVRTWEEGRRPGLDCEGTTAKQGASSFHHPLHFNLTLQLTDQKNFSE